LASDQNVEIVAEAHLEGACAFDVVVGLLDAFAAEAEAEPEPEAEDTIDGPSQHGRMDAASEAGH
jgi:hypothetical protein